MMQKIFLSGVLALLLGLLTGCSLPGGATPTAIPATQLPTPETPSATPTPGEITGEAQVDSLEVLVLESFPVQINVVARGSLPDGCTILDQASVTQEGNTLKITLPTRRPAGAVCTPALVPFEKVISLPVAGLPQGAYSVSAGQAAGAFSLAVDNALPVETPPATGSAEIRGMVFHDLCAVSGGEGGAPTVPGEGCVAAPSGGFQANGTLDPAEPGISGVLVTLGEGACPAIGLATATTDAEGKYGFPVDFPGTYCVSVDAQAGPNAGILLPGAWTSPSTGQASHSLSLTGAESSLENNFGWDFQFLPQPSTCTNKASFVSDVTIPDGTAIPPGQQFVKTWRLKNNGTCTWTTAYGLAFESGTQMGAASPLPLPKNVAPGESVDVSIQFTAPSTAANYQSRWMLQDATGTKFGLGKEAKDSFFVEIKVEQTSGGSDLGNLGEATWRDTFNSAANWFLLDTANYRFDVENGSLVMKARQTSQGEEWGLANTGELKNFYLEAKVTTGNTCTGLDRYGLLARAPESNKGYVYSFSCDGRFRLYQWDGEHYNPLQEWKASAFILSGPNQTNRIGIWLKATTIKLYANGKLLGEYTDTSFSKGRFGLLIGAPNTENLKMFVEEIAYWKLPE